MQVNITYDKDGRILRQTERDMAIAVPMFSRAEVLDIMLMELGVAAVASCLRSDADEAVVWRAKMQLFGGRLMQKARAATELQSLVSVGLLTAGQRAAVLSAWRAE